jgi:putative ABC transport system permease protein
MDVLQDLRYAVRSLSKSPGFAAVAIATLALGIGFNTAVFSVVDAVLFRPLEYARPEGLVRIWDDNPSKGVLRFSASPRNFVDWREQNRSLDGLAAFTEADATLLEGTEPEALRGFDVSPALFPVLGVRPALGRTFGADDEKPGRPPTAVLSWSLWRRRFGGDPSILGRAIRLEEKRAVVVGVMPRDFRFPTQTADLWFPFVLDEEALSNRGAHWVGVIGRLRPGVPLRQAQADFDTIAARLAASFPEKNTGWSQELVPLREAIVGESRRPLLVLFGAVGFVLLLACVNVSNLLLARGLARRREVSIRTAIGASRARILSQFLAESLVLSLAGGVAGAVCAVWGTDALVKLGGRSLPRSTEIAVDARTLGFALFACVAAALVAGVFPALSASAAPDGEALRESAGRATSSRRATSLRRVMLGAQLAITLVLLAGAALLLRSMSAALRVDPGFRADGVLTAELSLPASRYAQDEKVISFYDRLSERVRRLPGVTAVGTSIVPPMPGSVWHSLSVEIPDHPVPVQDEISLAYRVVGGEFFTAAGIPVRGGRVFGSEDRADAPLVAVLSETAARRCFPGEDPIGRTMVIGDRSKQPRRIVGVVGDVREIGPVDPPEASVYVPATQKPWSSAALLIRTSGDPASLAPMVRAEIRALDPALPVGEMAPLSNQIERALAQRRFVLMLLALFAVVALTLATIGMYGVASRAAAERTREVGVRVAMGARRRDILRLFVGEGVRVAAAGIGAGLHLTLAAARLIAGLLFGVSPTDPAAYASVCLLLCATLLLAILIPALRAARTDPLTALRAE